jgi:hypothetical protein
MLRPVTVTATDTCHGVPEIQAEKSSENRHVKWTPDLKKKAAFVDIQMLVSDLKDFKIQAPFLKHDGSFF